MYIEFFGQRWYILGEEAMPFKKMKNLKQCFAKYVQQNISFRGW